MASNDWKVGLFFHTFNGKREIVNQGRVCESLCDGAAFEIELFSWLDGSPLPRTVQPASFLDGAQFYKTAEAQGDEYERVAPRR